MSHRQLAAEEANIAGLEAAMAQVSGLLAAACPAKSGGGWPAQTGPAEAGPMEAGHLRSGFEY